MNASPKIIAYSMRRKMYDDGFFVENMNFCFCFLAGNTGLDYRMLWTDIRIGCEECLVPSIVRTWILKSAA